MFQSFNNRFGHYALLLAVAGVLIFPHLGRPSLWDIDEGNNAEAAREMMESENWIVPTFNYQLRVDKPALLYWLQIAGYRLCGVNELAARLPSALAALLTVLLVYELSRGMFNPATALIAGIMVVSTIGFCASAHFANPDALLHACTTLSLLIFWRSYAKSGRGWFVPAGIAAGFAVLAKGPVGLVLPLAVVASFLLWSGQLRLLWDRRLMWGGLAFTLVALPWYIWVTNDTKGDFLRGFFGTHNVNRFLNPMENHRGPVFYYLAVLAVGFAPWSIFSGFAAWYGTGERGRQDDGNTVGELKIGAVYRFLWCWIAVYLLFFSLAATKLPNYILPVYTPLAILTARFLERWRRQAIAPPHWAFLLSLSCLMLVGFGTSVGLLVAGGTIDMVKLHGRQLPGLASWALLGAFPVLGAASSWWCLRRQWRTALVGCVGLSAVFFIGTLATYGSVALDGFKAPRGLVQASKAQATQHEIRVGSYRYFQPSLVFYCRREVQQCATEEQALEFLRMPLQTYLFLPAVEWQALEGKLRGPHRLLARHYDLYRHGEIVVVTNR
jgi:4-amino-4-deoxy-L-arabinose transferase-like glycosyltransferase